MAQNSPNDELIRFVAGNPVLLWFAGLGIMGGIFYGFVRLAQKLFGNDTSNGKQTITLLDKQQVVIDNLIKANAALMEYFERMDDITDHRLDRDKKDET